MILIAHKEDCAIVLLGPTYKREMGRDNFKLEPTVCTCGGIKVRVPLWNPGSTDEWQLDFPNDGPA